MARVLRWVLAGWLLASLSVLAEDPPAEGEAAEGEGGEAVVPASAIYISMKPQFVVNYGGAGRLRYLKAEVAVRMQSSKAANSLRHHMPYIRNNMVMLFAGQTNESLSSQEGKEKLRQDALQEIRKVLKEEDGLEPEQVMEVFFNTLFIQK